MRRRRLLGVATASLIGLLLPMVASAETKIEAKDPLSYPAKQYGFVLGMAIFGGLVSFYARVRKGEVMALNITQLIGEIATSAFAGLLCFWLCELANSPSLLSASLVGVAGHMGPRAISIVEGYLMRRWAPGAQISVDDKKDAP